MHSSNDFFVLFFLCSASEEGHQRAGREHGQDRRPKPAKGTFHTLECPAQCMNWGSYPEGADRGLTSLSSYTVHHLFMFPFYYYYCYYLPLLLYFTLLQLLNCYLNLPSFSFASSPHPTRVGG